MISLSFCHSRCPLQHWPNPRYPSWQFNQAGLIRCHRRPDGGSARDTRRGGSIHGLRSNRRGIRPESMEIRSTTLLKNPGTNPYAGSRAHHVVSGSFDADSLVGRDSIETLAGTTLSLEVARDRLLVGDAGESADIQASNGVVHLIDRVLLPPAPVSPLKAFLERAIERGVPLFNEGSPRDAPLCTPPHLKPWSRATAGASIPSSGEIAQHPRRDIEHQRPR